MRTQQHPRHGGLDRLERPAVGVAGLGVEGVGLARAARHPEQNARLPPARVRGRISRQGLDPARSRAPSAKAPAAASRIICRRVSCGTGRFARLMATLPLCPAKGRESSLTGQATHAGDVLHGRRSDQWFRWNSGPFKMAQKMSASAFAFSPRSFCRSTNRHQQLHLIGPSGGGSASPGKGSRSDRACPGTALRRSRPGPGSPPGLSHPRCKTRSSSRAPR